MAVKFFLATTGTQINMVSSWEDELYCSILKDGSISLRASKDGEDEYGGRWWFKARRGIKTPRQFIDAFHDIDELEVETWDMQDDILPKLFNHLPLFAALTHKLEEIDNEGTDTELDFFLFSQNVILKSEITLPRNFQSAVKIVEILYNFVEQHFQTHGQLPRGTHELMGTSVSFPKRAIRKNKDHERFKAEQMLKSHVNNAAWELKRTRLHGFAMSQQYQDIFKFCRTYFDQHNKLPIGKFHIGQTEVTFNDQT